MDVTTTAWTITRAEAPEDLDAPEAWALHGHHRMAYVVDVALYGHDDLTYTLRDSWSYLRNQEYSTRVLLVATATPEPSSPDDVVGSVSVSMPLKGNQHLAMLGLRVHPDHRRCGVGTALLHAAEQMASATGRTSFMLSSEHAGEPPADDPTVLQPPSGSGRIRRDDPAAAFALRHGYALEQAERYSVLPLPVDPALLDRLHTDAAEKAGADYRLVSWTDRTPDEWLDDLAHLNTRMSTDAPVGGLDIEEDPWDAARVRTQEAEIAGRENRYAIVAAEHVPSASLVAYTMVELPTTKPRVVYQEDTLVLREHRGHRLGLLVKAEMLRLLGRVRPEATAVHTWNAEENAYMLGINVALGFRPAGVEGLWQKRIAVSR